mmetsp:Transcript_23969/g.34321  ORF Transcript_23969/g.34321 Transcript_23969/m.34321 type:complete len:88 (-) Transcript_23969:25-288(-)
MVSLHRTTPDHSQPDHNAARHHESQLASGAHDEKRNTGQIFKSGNFIVKYDNNNKTNNICTGTQIIVAYTECYFCVFIVAWVKESES